MKNFFTSYYKVTYYIKWVKTSCTANILCIRRFIPISAFCLLFVVFLSLLYICAVYGQFVLVLKYTTSVHMVTNALERSNYLLFFTPYTKSCFRLNYSNIRSGSSRAHSQVNINRLCAQTL